MAWLKILFFIIGLFHISHGWTDIFNYRSCYQQKMVNRMPLSIDNLIALIEKFEMVHLQTTPEHIAEAILKRYKTNGVIFQQENTAIPWATSQDFEAWKQKLDTKLLKPSIDTPIDSFLPREECAIHMSVSHSTDVYPHAGVDVSWENNRPYYRSKRAVESESRNSDTIEVATHPIEFGVIQTTSGPISGGLLIAGIMTMYDSSEYAVKDLVDVDEMPNEMAVKKIDQLYGSTLSGKLGEAALLSYNDNNEDYFEIGPIGIFGNCTSCARIFSLENSDYSYFSRAEVFGSLDGLIIAKTLYNRGDSRTLKLSQILRMYYSEHGLFNQEIRACNRQYLFNQLKAINEEEIKTQALNYMYAYQTYISKAADLVKINQDDFVKLEGIFTELLDKIYQEFDRFMSTYSFDDPDAQECPLYKDDELRFETETDLVVIFTPIGTQEDVESQVQYISATARKIGVGYHRSKMAIFNGKNMDWHSPLTNYSNIADFSCNYTTFMTYGTTSSQNFIFVLDKLTNYFMEFYSNMKKTEEHIGIRNQVVMWNLPEEFDTQSDEFAARDAWNDFNMTFPDVNFIFVGEEPLDFFSSVFWGGEGNTNARDEQKIFLVDNTPKDEPITIADNIISYIKLVPRTFIYPACDTSNESLADYQETRHQYVNFVTPNYTTLICIHPQNFHFSEHVKLMFDKSDTDICVSRTVPIPSIAGREDERTCKDGTTSPEFEQMYLCDRYVEDCNPIYISISGKGSSDEYCSDEKCKFPNQIKFTMTHEGMVCGGWAILPTPMLLLLAIGLHYFKF